MPKGGKREADFQEVKNKVGKKLKPAANATRTDFKSRSIHVTLPSLPTEGEAVTHRRQTLKDLLVKLGHPNHNVRRDTVLGVKNYYEVNPEQLQLASSLVHMLERVVVLLRDPHQQVRRA